MYFIIKYIVGIPKIFAYKHLNLSDWQNYILDNEFNRNSSDFIINKIKIVSTKFQISELTITNWLTLNYSKNDPIDFNFMEICKYHYYLVNGKVLTFAQQQNIPSFSSYLGNTMPNTDVYNKSIEPNYNVQKVNTYPASTISLKNTPRKVGQRQEISPCSSHLGNTMPNTHIFKKLIEPCYNVQKMNTYPGSTFNLKNTQHFQNVRKESFYENLFKINIHIDIDDINLYPYPGSGYNSFTLLNDLRSYMVGVDFSDFTIFRFL